VGGTGLWEFPKIWGFPDNISATAGASDFKFGAQLGFAKLHRKITCRRKGGRGPGLGGSPSIFTQWLKLCRNIVIVSHIIIIVIIIIHSLFTIEPKAGHNQD